MNLIRRRQSKKIKKARKENLKESYDQGGAKSIRRNNYGESEEK